MNNSNTISRLWILGASDPEMSAIEKLLRDKGERIAYAMVNDSRVNPGTAYRATEVSGSYSWGDATHTVECDVLHGIPRTTLAGVPLPPVTRIDHHRPGDAGYGQPPLNYFIGSSLGQVWSKFAVDDGDPAGDYANIPDELLLVAAADHCLEAAYRGQCPGVDPEALMQWRAESRAAFQKRPVQAVMADVEAARLRLREATKAHPIEYADLRGEFIPELPEAACREGIPFLSTVKDRDGREKVVLMAAPPELVRRFQAGEIVPGLVDMYGDPARGFAGGYIK